MAKKQEKEIERWVTVNGARVPIFKDGSIGGPKEIRELITGKKATKAKKNIDKPQNELTDKQKKTLAKKELKKHPNDSKTGLLKHQAGEDKNKANKSVAKAEKVDNITGKNVKWLDYNIKQQGLGMESADMEDIKRDAKFMNGEKISLYDKAGNEYRGTFNVYNDGGMEVVDIKKEWHNRKPDDTHSTGVKYDRPKTSKQIDKDFDTKEKQIARNKKEVDERNSKNEETTVSKKETKSPVAQARDMTESELRAYIKKHNLTKEYNIMMNTRPGAYEYSKQLRVLRDLVADHLARKKK